MPGTDIHVTCPNCGGGYIAAVTLVPREQEVTAWDRDEHGKLHPDAYEGHDETYWEAEVEPHDEKPYKCLDCSLGLTIDDLVVI